MITLPKPTDLSHLVDSRIGNPDASPDNKCINGTFDTDTTGWAFSNGGIGTIENGRLKLANSLGASSRTTYDFDVELGKTYLLTAKNYEGTHRGRMVWSGITLANWTEDGIMYKIAVADSDASTQQLRLDCLGTTIGNYTYFDDVTIQEWDGEELVPDPSIGFVVNDATTWAANGTNDLSQDGNAVKITYVDHALGGFRRIRAADNNAFSEFASGEKVNLVIRAKVNTGSSCLLEIYDGVAYTDSLTITNTSYEDKVFTTTMQGTNLTVRASSMDAGEIIWIEVRSVMKVTGLLAAYNMIPSPGGVLVDISGQGNNGGSFTNVVSSKDGMKFSGDGNIELFDANGMYAISIAIRFKINSAATNNALIAAGSTFLYVRFDTGGTLVWQLFDGAGISNLSSVTDVVPDNWHDLVLTFNDGVMNAYLDGVLLASSADDDFGGWTNATQINLGNRNSADFLDGELADLMIFNYNLSEQEAKDYHNSFQKLTKRGNLSDYSVGSTI